MKPTKSKSSRMRLLHVEVDRSLRARIDAHVADANARLRQRSPHPPRAYLLTRSDIVRAALEYYLARREGSDEGVVTPPQLH